MNQSNITGARVLKNILVRHWFFIGIAVVIAVAFAFPSSGRLLKTWRVLEIGIFIAFLITGLKLDTIALLSEMRNVKTPCVAMLSTFVLFPLATFFLARLFFSGTPDFVVGACIIAVAPVTVASGLVMTTQARGNVPLALLICVASNLLCIFTIPPSLELLLRFNHGIKLPMLDMIWNLLYIVILPVVVGQILRIKLKASLHSSGQAFSIFSQVIILLIIFNAVSGSVQKIGQAGWSLAGVAVFMIGMHSLYLLGNNAIARILLLDHPSRAAFTIQTSQKTLTVSYIIWSGWFSVAYPLAMTPAIMYHLTQMIMDTMVAHGFRKNVDKCE